MVLDETKNKIAAKEVAKRSQLKRCDSGASGKPEGFSMLGSSAFCVSASNDWTEISTHSSADNMRNYSSFNRCEGTLAGSEPPCSSTYSLSNRTPMLEELITRSKIHPYSELASSSNGREGINIRNLQWRHLNEFGTLHKVRNHFAYLKPKDGDIMPSNYWGDFQRIPLDIKNFNPSEREVHDKDRDEISAHATHNFKSTNSDFSPISESSRSVMLSSSGFSKFFLKQTFIGNEGPAKNKVFEAESNSTGMDHNKRKQTFTSTAGPDMLLNYSEKSDQVSDGDIHMVEPELFGDGISLREYLRPGCHKINKTKRLQLFKQIVQFMDFSHSEGFVLQDLRPSRLILLPSYVVKYTGGLRKRALSSVLSSNIKKKRLPEQAMHARSHLYEKAQNHGQLADLLRRHPQFSPPFGNSSQSSVMTSASTPDASFMGVRTFKQSDLEAQGSTNYRNTATRTPKMLTFMAMELEIKWYACPEGSDDGNLLSSNIYSLGVLLFELLSCFESFEMHSTAMSDLSYRILPRKFLSEHPNEAGFILWLLHPEPGSRPTTRDILQSKLICDSQDACLNDSVPLSVEEDDIESELLLYFLVSLNEQKQKHASKLIESIECLESDIREVERRHLRTSLDWPSKNQQEEKWGHHLQNSSSHSKFLAATNMLEARLMRDISQLENAYFYMRSQIFEKSLAVGRADKDLLRNRERCSWFQTEKEELKMEKKPSDRLGALFEDVCRFARYCKFEVYGTLRNNDLLNSANVICALSFDRDEDNFAAAGVSKKIKIFDCESLLDDSIDIHYPVVELSNNSKLSCVCWNNYMKNYLASTDYDGVVQVWDASSGQVFSKYVEHQKRAWSVDFSHVDPTNFASGSDDCSVKLWSMNEKNSISTIWSPANICCVQFSSHSSHLLAFGSANYKIYCYDLRNTRIPWCSLSGHEKAVSYVKFLDAETIVSASTDNTLKLWNLNYTSLDGVSSSCCSLTFTGHTNKKNFVGLSVSDGYIACGSESNEVYAYYRSLSTPITSYKFEAADRIPEHETADNSGQFVSSVCWGDKSNMVVAANSSGTIKLLRMLQVEWFKMNHFKFE